MKAVTTSEVLDQFRAALCAREIVPPDSIIADGRLHRCTAAMRRARAAQGMRPTCCIWTACRLEAWRTGEMAGAGRPGGWTLVAS